MASSSAQKRIWFAMQTRLQHRLDCNTDWNLSQADRPRSGAHGTRIHRAVGSAARCSKTVLPGVVFRALFVYFVTRSSTILSPSTGKKYSHEEFPAMKTHSSSFLATFFRYGSLASEIQFFARRTGRIPA